MTRKTFSTQTKKRIWMLATGRDPEKWRGSDFIKTSKCEACKIKLKWDEKHSYDFDHLDNNNSRNTILNCGLLCVKCHRKNTKHHATTYSLFGNSRKLKVTTTKKRLLNKRKKEKESLKKKKIMNNVKLFKTTKPKKSY